MDTIYNFFERNWRIALIIIAFFVVNYFYPIAGKILIVLIFIGLGSIELILGKEMINDFIDSLINTEGDYFADGNTNGTKQISQPKWQGYVQVLNKKIKLFTSVFYGFIVTLIAILPIGIIDGLNYGYSFLGGFIVFVILYLLPEKEESFDVPSGSVGSIYIKGSLKETLQTDTKGGKFTYINSIPLIGKKMMFMESLEIDPIHIEVIVKDATTNGAGKTRGVPLIIPLSIELVPVYFSSIVKLTKNNEKGAENHIIGIFNEIVGEVADGLTFDEIFGPNGTKKFYDALIEKIKQYKTVQQYFIKDDEDLKPIDDRHALIQFDAIDMKTGYGIKIILNPIMPADEELAKSLSAKKTAELNMEAETLKGDKRLLLVKKVSESLRGEDFFDNLTASQKDALVSKMLNLDDEFNKTERKIFDFGLDSTQSKDLIDGIAKAIIAKLL